MPPSNQFPAPQYTPPPQQPQPPQLPPQSTPPQQPGQSPYDFFMEDGGNSRRASFSGGNDKKKLIFLGAVGVALIFVLIAIFALAFGGKKGPTPITSVITDQQELIRVATDGVKNAKAPNLQNFAITAQLTLTSAQVDSIKLAAKHGTKVTDKQLKAVQNAQTDQALNSSLTVNTYDSTFAGIMSTELNKYEKDLAKVYPLVKSGPERDLVKKQADGAELLKKQLTTQ